jgi:hypothetical protein
VLREFYSSGSRGLKAQHAGYVVKVALGRAVQGYAIFCEWLEENYGDDEKQKTEAAAFLRLGSGPFSQFLVDVILFLESRGIAAIVTPMLHDRSPST